MKKNYDQSVELNHNVNWPYIPDHPDRTLIIGSSESGKINLLLNLVKHQRPDNDKIYLYFKGQLESKYKFLINRKEKLAIKKSKAPKEFIDYSETIDDIYEILEDYNPTKKKSVASV